MVKSIAFAVDASRLASFAVQLPTSEDVAFVGPCQPGASTKLIDRLAIRGPVLAHD
jgi:hypothetical protein